MDRGAVAVQVVLVVEVPYQLVVFMVVEVGVMIMALKLVMVETVLLE
jgi:hypothetical protein